MIDTLWALGRTLLLEGFETPFAELKQAYHYQNLTEAREEMKKVGWMIHDKGLPGSLVPLVCGFLGYGRVSRGAQEMFDLLPFEEVKPEDIRLLFKRRKRAANRLYKVIFREEHMVKPLSPAKEFDLHDYYKNPQNYTPVVESYLPYLTVVLNCIYWSPRYPRIITRKGLKRLFLEDPSPRLRVIGDISCDVEGAVEATLRATTPDAPVFVYDPVEDRVVDGFEGRGVVIMAVDNLPAEIPLESSIFFSQALKPFIPGIAAADYSKDFPGCNLPEPAKRGVLLAGKNSARYLREGREVHSPSPEIFESCSVVDIYGLGRFEAYPNRDSLPYIRLYGLDGLKTMFRGTLRYPGWCLLMKKIIELGLLSEEERDWSGWSRKQFLGSFLPRSEEDDLRVCPAGRLNLEKDSSLIRALEWLGLFNDSSLLLEKGSPLDIMALLMTEKLQYGEGERDMIVLQHGISAVYPDGKKEKVTSTLIDFGTPFGDSSMARTVGLPAAMATKLILEGMIRMNGVQIPVHPEIYLPILRELKEKGIVFKEKREAVP